MKIKFSRGKATGKLVGIQNIYILQQMIKVINKILLKKNMIKNMYLIIKCFIEELNMLGLDFLS